LTELARMKRFAGKAEEALPLIEKACTIKPNHDWNRIEFAYTLREVGRTEEASAIFTALANDSPAATPSLIALGQMAQARADHRAASGFFERAARRSQSPADALRRLAEARSAMGDFPAAEQAITRLLAEANTASFNGYMALGKLKRAMNDRTAAREAFQRAAEIEPKNTQPHVQIAVVELGGGHVENAVAALETALSLNPGDH
jgi:tetratricopeptide (TPR) repeat protein